MKPKWLIEKDIFNENLTRLTDEITKQGFEYKIVQHIPFGGGTYDNFPDEDCIIFYGSLNLGKQLQREKKWVPGVYNNMRELECLNYYGHMGKWLLNSPYMFITIKELLRTKDFCFDIFGNKDDELFVRPSSGYKPFTGMVVGRTRMSQETLGYGYYHEDPSLLVAISGAKQISREWRVVIGDKKVITGSQYKINNELEVLNDFPKEVEDYAQSIIPEDWQPDRLFVMDIAEYNNELYLLELNSFSSSGLYDCDLGRIVEVASKIALEDWRETYGEWSGDSFSCEHANEVPCVCPCPPECYCKLNSCKPRSQK